MDTFRRNTLIILTIVSLMVSALHAKAQNVALSLHTPDVTCIVKPGQEKDVYILAGNTVNTTVTGRLSLTIESFDGTRCAVNHDLDLTGSSTRRVSLPKAAFARRGIKWVRAEFTTTDGDSTDLDASFAYAVPAVDSLRGRYEDSESMRFGIAYGASPDNISDAAAQRAAAIGVNTLRANPYWHRAQPKPGTWDWEYTDQLISVHGAYDIKLQPLVSGSARWAVPANPDGSQGGQSSAPDPEAWRLWICGLAKHLKGKAQHWEIWNEPDIGFFSGTQEQYMEMLRIAHEEIKKVDSAVACMTGGFVAMDHHGRKPLMIQRVLAECQDSFDAIAYHTHGDFKRFQEEIDTRLLPYCARALRKPKRLYFTETGMDTRHGQHFQAATVPKKMVFAWSRGAIAYTWFNLHDMLHAKHDKQPGFTYGLFTKWARKPGASGWGPDAVDYTVAFPKAAYVAYNTTATVLRGLRFRRQVNLGADKYVFVFDGEERQGLVAWLETSGSASFHGIISCDGDIETVDLMGNAAKLPKVRGRAVFEAGGTPVFVRSDSRHPIRFEGVLVEAIAETHVIPGEPADVTVAISNPLDHSIDVNLKWNPGPAQFVDGDQTRISVGPRQTQQLKRCIMLPRSQGGCALGSGLGCTLETEFEGTPWRDKTQLPIRVGGVLMGNELPEKPLIQLRDIGHVVNLSEHDPHTVHLLWNGPSDLSVSAKLARATAGIEFEITVQDDVFHAPAGIPLQETDCLQIALKLPESQGSCLLTVGDTQNRPTVRAAMPDGKDVPALTARIRVSEERRTYRLNLPDAAFGWDDNLLRGNGIYFNVAIRDNDGRGLKGWMELAPGFGKGQGASENWVRAVFK